MEIYLDNAATSHPKPESVIKAVVKALTEDNANPGRSGHTRALRAGNTVLEAREAVSSLLGASDPFEIVFTFNCTDALNLVIKGVLQKGDHAVCSALSHNSVLRPLFELQKSGVITLTILSPESNGFLDPSRFAREIRSTTKLFAITHASNVTGAVQPVKSVSSIARMHGIMCLIDGAQAAGMHALNVNELGCDFYAFPGHKGLLGPQGTGGLYIAPGRRLKTLRDGGTGTSSESFYQPEELPERYEAGTVNLPGIAGLMEGAKYARENLDKIIRTEQTISQYLYEELNKIPGVIVYSPANPLMRTGVISFNIQDHSSGAAAQALSEEGICVRGGLHCAPLAHKFLGTLSRGAVRASVGYQTGLSDAEALVKAVYALSKRA
ncbi:MAG: aminotransferase class V-fold PLP-dependent enzyme [Clostridia bacterium]|nr:aminotransferase class V-fold PLP-dependent enzyme [Clostridia bacterium]